MAQQHSRGFFRPNYRQLRLSIMEVMLLGAALLILLMTSFDALEGSQVGKSNALELAKQQGQPSILAERWK